MALKLFDRVKDTTDTAGTGPITLNAAPATGFRSFGSVLDAGDTFPYALIAGTAWETGIGTMTGETTFSRALSESSTGSLINLPGTSCEVCLTQTSEAVRLQSKAARVMSVTMGVAL